MKRTKVFEFSISRWCNEKVWNWLKEDGYIKNNELKVKDTEFEDLWGMYSPEFDRKIIDELRLENKEE